MTLDVVLNVYETVDVMVSWLDKVYEQRKCNLRLFLKSIARAGRYNELDIPVGEALEARPKVVRSIPSGCSIINWW